jgi:hypothetical protein
MTKMKFFKALPNGTIAVARVRIAQVRYYPYGSMRPLAPQEAIAQANKQGFFTRKQLGRAAFAGKKMVEVRR